MAQQQPFVSNIPLQVAKNLRFPDDNGILVTQMLPIGMNGTIAADNPKTGYISLIGATLSNQIDLYNNVVETLNTYEQDITALQTAVSELQTSGSTVPNVDGYCFTGSAQSPITTVVQLIAQSACDYNAVLGETSALAEAILAEGASALNVLPAFGVNSAMTGLSGWVSVPETIADAVNNLWLSYLDSRAGITKALAAVTSTCKQVVIDFKPVFTASGNTTPSGFNIYFSGYSFIPSGYIDNSSTIVITDGIGGSVTKAIDIVSLSALGASSFFVNISGTPLLPTASSYQVQVNSAVINSSIGATCSKVVIHNTPSGGSSSSCSNYQTGDYSTSGVTSAPITLSSTLSFAPAFVDIMAIDANSASILHSNAYFITPTAAGALLTFPAISGNTGSLNIKWIAYNSNTYV